MAISFHIICTKLYLHLNPHSLPPECPPNVCQVSAKCPPSVRQVYSCRSCLKNKDRAYCSMNTMPRLTTTLSRRIVHNNNIVGDLKLLVYLSKATSKRQIQIHRYIA